MSLLKRITQLIFGPPAPARGDDIGLYYYIRSNHDGEVIRVRINPNNDLSQSDDGGSYFVHKTIVGKRSFHRIEADFSYNAARKLIDSQIVGGVLVDEAAYREYLKQQQKQGG